MPSDNQRTHSNWILPPLLAIHHTRFLGDHIRTSRSKKRTLYSIGSPCHLRSLRQLTLKHLILSPAASKIRCLNDPPAKVAAFKQFDDARKPFRDIRLCVRRSGTADFTARPRTDSFTATSAPSASSAVCFGQVIANGGRRSTRAQDADRVTADVRTRKVLYSSSASPAAA